MKILVATGKHGNNGKDFCWTNDGEMLKFGSFECDNPGCGCNRSWVGIDSSKATTTAKVVSSKILDTEGLASHIYSSLIREKWININISLKEKQIYETRCKEDAEELVKIAKRYKIGTIVRRHGKIINVEKWFVKI